MNTKRIIAFIIILLIAVISSLLAFKIIKINLFGDNQPLIAVLILLISSAILERISRN